MLRGFQPFRRKASAFVKGTLLTKRRTGSIEEFEDVVPAAGDHVKEILVAHPARDSEGLIIVHDAQTETGVPHFVEQVVVTVHSVQ